MAAKQKSQETKGFECIFPSQAADLNSPDIFIINPESKQGQQELISATILSSLPPLEGEINMRR